MMAASNQNHNKPSDTIVYAGGSAFMFIMINSPGPGQGVISPAGWTASRANVIIISYIATMLFIVCLSNYPL